LAFPKHEERHGTKRQEPCKRVPAICRSPFGFAGLPFPIGWTV